MSANSVDSEPVFGLPLRMMLPGAAGFDAALGPPSPPPVGQLPPAVVAATGSESAAAAAAAASSEASLLPATGSESTTAANSSSEASLLPATGAESTAATATAAAATAATGAALPLPAATAQGLPATGAFYKLRLASGEFLRGDVKTKKGVRKLTSTAIESFGSVFFLEAPAKEKKGRVAFFMCDGGYLRAPEEQKPVSTTLAKKGAKSWERFTLKPVAGGCQILSHWDTPLAFKSPTDSMIYAGKEPVTAGVPLTVSFVGVAEPTAGLTRFTPQPATKKAAKKRASAGGDGSSTVEQAAAKQPKGSPAVSPVPPAALPSSVVLSSSYTGREFYAQLQQCMGDEQADKWLNSVRQ